MIYVVYYKSTKKPLQFTFLENKNYRMLLAVQTCSSHTSVLCHTTAPNANLKRQCVCVITHSTKIIGEYKLELYDLKTAISLKMKITVFAI